MLRLSGHSVKEIANFFFFFLNVVEKGVLRQDNQEADDRLFWSVVSENQSSWSKAQTKQFNKEDCQESSTEKY